MKIPSFTLSLVLATLPLSASASPVATPEKTHLIETAPGVQYWASPSELAAISDRAHHEGKCGGFMDLTHSDLASFVAPYSPVWTSVNLGDLDPKEHARVQPLLKLANEGDLIAHVTRLSSFPNRYYQNQEGVDAAHWIRSQFEAMGAGRNDVRVELVQHKFKQPSVIATIEGSGPQKDEIVVIGGHIDSISGMFNPKAHAPGADDNASGTATVLETFKIVAQSSFRPNRTIQFMGYAGEEKGLLGSQDIANRYRKEGKKVVGALQFDMTMYPGPTPRITFISDYTNRDLNRFLQKLSDEYVKAAWTEDKCGYPCSDHASWTRAGFASSFPFETAFSGSNPDIHTPRDTLDKLDPSHGTHYLKLGIAFAIELAQAPAFWGTETPNLPRTEAPAPRAPSKASRWPNSK